MAFTNGCSKWSFEGNCVLLDTNDTLFWYHLLSILDRWCHIDFFPVDGDIGSSVDFLDTLGDLRDRGMD